MDITEMIFRAAKTGYSIVIIVCSLGPMVNYILSGEMMPSLPIYFLEMNAETFANFFLIVCVQSIMLLTACCVHYQFDITITALFVNMLLVASVIVQDIRELLHFISRREYAPAASNWRLIKIVLMHTKYNE